MVLVFLLNFVGWVARAEGRSKEEADKPIRMDDVKTWKPQRINKS